MTVSVMACGMLVGLVFGFVLGVEYPPCVPNDQRGCNVASGALGVEHCNRNGFGWAPCVGFTP